MSWVRLDDKFHSNPKVVAVGNAGAGAYARALSYCADHLTDGMVPAAWFKSVAPPKLRARMIEVGLVIETPIGFKIEDYLTLNPSKADVLEKRAKRAAAGKVGADARWGSDGKSHDTPHADRTYNGNAPQPRPQPHVIPDRPVGNLSNGRTALTGTARALTGKRE